MNWNGLTSFNGKRPPPITLCDFKNPLAISTCEKVWLRSKRPHAFFMPKMISRSPSTKAARWQMAFPARSLSRSKAKTIYCWAMNQRGRNALLERKNSYGHIRSDLSSWSQEIVLPYRSRYPLFQQQDHWANAGFYSTAATRAGIEVAHMIRKGQRCQNGVSPFKQFATLAG